MIESRFVDTADLRFHYLHAGKAGNPPVVLLHGFPQTAHMWRHQIEALSETYEVFAPDTRGYGQTDKPGIRVTRDILGRDVIEFIDALALDEVMLGGHDWGGIIAFKAALDHPERVSRLALVDTLTSVWIPWGIHGYWFKCEPQAEQFWEAHAEEFIRSVFGGVEGSYAGPPASPWKAPEGADTDPGDAMSDWEPAKYWSAEDVDHYVQAFTQPGSLHHAVEYYRHALPFHIGREDADAPHGVRYEFLSNPRVAEMWNHEGLLWSHPDYEHWMVFAPEDRHRTFANPTLYLYSAFLMPQAFEQGFPADDHIPHGNPYADSFIDHFPDYRARPASTGHFIPEEDPERTNEVLSAFFAGDI